ncbi:MAG TPA: hypothetical protein VIY69_12665 [Candidatus Acidoferrales bacterium]
MFRPRGMAGLFLACALSLFLPSLATGQNNQLKPPLGFDLASEMKALYGDYDVRSQTSSIEIPGGSPDTSNSWSVEAFSVAGFRDSGIDKVIVATYATPDDTPDFNCRACIPLIGAAIFAKTAKGWTVEASEKPGFPDGFEGSPPDAKLIQFGPHAYGIELDYQVDGYDGYWTSTALFLPWRGGFGAALQLIGAQRSYEGCAQQPPCYLSQSVLKFVPGNNSEYYHLLVTTTGAEPDTSKTGALKDVSGTKLLHFADGKYE